VITPSPHIQEALAQIVPLWPEELKPFKPPTTSAQDTYLPPEDYKLFKATITVLPLQEPEVFKPSKLPEHAQLFNTSDVINNLQLPPHVLLSESQEPQLPVPLQDLPPVPLQDLPPVPLQDLPPVLLQDQPPLPSQLVPLQEPPLVPLELLPTPLDLPLVLLQEPPLVPLELLPMPLDLPLVPLLAPLVLLPMLLVPLPDQPLPQLPLETLQDMLPPVSK
jgi:hypothetical protein